MLPLDDPRAAWPLRRLGHALGDRVGCPFVLIDGPRLAELMIKYRVGVQVKQSYDIVELDVDFFESSPAPADSASLALLSGGAMATLTIRNLSEATRRALKERAARHNHSMEAEVRSILDAAVDRDSDFVTTWLDAAEGLRGGFDAPPRSSAREIDLS